MTAVRLLMDSVPVLSPGGERLQVELAAAVDRTRPADATALLLRRTDQRQIDGLESIDVLAVNDPVGTLRQKARWLRRQLPRHARRFAATAAFEAGGIFSSRLQRRCGVVTTTNNMVIFAPELMGPMPRLSSGRLRWALLRALSVRSLRLADRVVLHSEHALRTISAFTGDLSPKTVVVHTGVPADTRLDTEEPPPHPWEGRPYLFYLSVIRAPKNHLRLIDAYDAVAARMVEPPDLILAGVLEDPEWLRAIERRIAARSAAAGRVLYVGRLPRDSIASWLHHATINVFPSLAETNSVIIAEILGAHGVLAASAIASIREVAGSAAAYFDPRDPESIAALIEELSRDPGRRRALRRAARSRAADLSWDACGEAIWDSARRACRGAARPCD
jgi:glycosyltransferase involved in cell wall biosynthesis